MGQKCRGRVGLPGAETGGLALHAGGGGALVWASAWIKPIKKRRPAKFLI